MGLLRRLLVERIRPRDASSTPARSCATVSGSGPSPVANATEAIVARATQEAQEGRLAASLKLLNEALEGNPGDAQLLYARGLTLSDWGRIREAHRDLTAAEALGLRSVGVHVNLAQTSHLLGMLDIAERHARLAIAEDPSTLRPHLVLASVMQGLGGFERAIECYRRALEIAPDRIDCLFYIAGCQLAMKDGRAAESTSRELLDREAEPLARSFVSLGMALFLQQRDSEALAAIERAEGIEVRTGERALTFVTHGFVLLNSGNPDRAVDVYERHLPTAPHAGATGTYGMSLLALGCFPAGWERYELRRLEDPFRRARPQYDCPAWDGQPLAGRTLLVWAEQGMGDTVQFVRYAASLRERGARVLLYVPEHMRAFAADFDDIDRVVAGVEAVGERVDYQISLMSLPRAVGTTLATIPARIPYLRVDARYAEQWRERIASDGKVKVGLVWAGNPRHENDARRSMPLASLAPLLGVEGCRFYSLQKERRAGDDASSGGITDLAPHLSDLRDAAAAIAGLDLVVSVDTVVAHIAGALGKPVWLVVPYASEFRWLRDRDDSPWYPSMRIFRQARAGAWDTVVERVKDALRAVVQAQSPVDREEALRPTRCFAASLEASPSPDSRERPRLSRIRDTRYGLLQYLAEPADMARSLEHCGEWLHAHIELLARVIPAGATAIEAGSCFGAHAVALARLVGPAGHVIAYESDAMRRLVLARNIATNVDSAVATVMMRPLASDDVAHARSPSAAGDSAADCDTIDDLALDALDLVKINAGEPARAILHGATDTLWRLRPAILVSATDRTEIQPLVDLARSFGYRCWRVDAALFDASNFNRRESDIFGGRAVPAFLAIAEERAPTRLDGGVET